MSPLNKRRKTVHTTALPTYFFIGRETAPPYAWNQDEDLLHSNLVWLIEDTIDAGKFERLYLKEMRGKLKRMEALQDQPNERRQKAEKTSSTRATSETIDFTQPNSDDGPITRVTVAPALPCRGSKTCTSHSVPSYPRKRTSSKLSFQIFPVQKAQSETFDIVRNEKRRMDEEGSGSVVENKERRATMVSITGCGEGCQYRG